jgi:hypothetical protein
MKRRQDSWAHGDSCADSEPFLIVEDLHDATYAMRQQLRSSSILSAPGNADRLQAAYNTAVSEANLDERGAKTDEDRGICQQEVESRAWLRHPIKRNSETESFLLQ